ncbi:MAG: hypothetical protein ACR2K2_10515 [Mycobacteriales bacterium]
MRLPASLSGLPRETFALALVAFCVRPDQAPAAGMLIVISLPSRKPRSSSSLSQLQKLPGS